MQNEAKIAAEKFAKMINNLSDLVVTYFKGLAIDGYDVNESRTTARDMIVKLSGNKIGEVAATNIVRVAIMKFNKELTGVETYSKSDLKQICNHIGNISK